MQLKLKKTEPPKNPITTSSDLVKIPLGLLIRASGLGGKAPLVYFLLWHMKTKSGETCLKIGKLQVELVGIKKDTARRPLVTLQRAGLIELVTRRGRRPIVTFLEAPKAETVKR